MKPTKQTVYLPVNGEQEKVVCHDYPDWMDTITGVLEKEGYFFTPEQLNEYTANVIKQTLHIAAKTRRTGFYDSTKEEQAITNTFNENFKKFKV